MANRLSKTLVTFRGPFVLDGHEEVWPAGNYVVETEEEPLDGASFLAFRRIATTLIVHPQAGGRVPTRFVEIDPAELDVALRMDRERAEGSDGLDTRTAGTTRQGTKRSWG